MTVGDLMRALIAEMVGTLGPITLAFTDASDSDGEPW